MASLRFEDNRLETNDNESVLDALTRHGYEIPSGCKSGVCQTCLMSLQEGDLPRQAQQGLSASQVALNYFLSCQCVTDSPLAVKQIDGDQLKTTGIVVSKELLGEQVLRLKIKANIDFLPGQYLTLWRDDNVGRSYSIASRPEEGLIECHIKVIENGQFSTWARDELDVGDEVTLQGPMGNCIFSAEPEQPLLLVGIGTGLAPLYGIVKQAIANHHQGPIQLIVGAKDRAGFYLTDELMALTATHSRLTVHLLCQNMEDDGDIYQFCRGSFPELNGWRIFICGADSFVTKMHKQCFLAGAAMTDISADRFLSCSS